jgi:UDP-N-acetyl-D-galactosamine dehydrogenase
MGYFIANKVIKLMINKGAKVKSGNALILGFTFKENCSDIRNTKVIDIYNELKNFGLTVDVYDPLVNSDEIQHEYKINTTDNLGKYDCVILAVEHSNFNNIDFSSLLLDENSVLFDVKSFIKNIKVDGRL